MNLHTVCGVRVTAVPSCTKCSFLKQPFLPSSMLPIWTGGKSHWNPNKSRYVKIHGSYIDIGGLEEWKKQTQTLKFFYVYHFYEIFFQVFY